MEPSEIKALQQTIESSLHQIGVNKGDTILVHSDGSIVQELTNLRWSKALNILKEAFLNVLGKEGTLIVPTFNWDFCKGKPYVHEKTRSQVGMFTNNVLFDDRAFRSFHPIYSFAGIGPNAKELLSNVSNSSFGENSFFQRLHQNNTKIVFFNVEFEMCTFLHYIEQDQKVPYRFLKTFEGDVTINNQTSQGEYDFYVRYLDDHREMNLGVITDHLLKQNILDRTVIFDDCPVSMAKSLDIYQASVQKIQANPYYFTK